MVPCRKVVEKISESGRGSPSPYPPDHYKHVCQMAKEKKVSNAWVIRDAVEKYIEEEASSSKPGKSR